MKLICIYRKSLKIGQKTIGYLLNLLKPVSIKLEPKEYIKLDRSFCHEVYLTVWLNQFETKKKCIEFVIHNMPVQGNYFKIKWNLKRNESTDIASLFFCEVNGIAPGFLFSIFRTL